MKLKNAIARKYFLHDHDTYENRFKCCFFSERPYDESGWGFWVRPDGTVDIDKVSSNGSLPDRKTVEACIRAAVKHLAE